MILNIKPVYDESLDCLQSVIASAMTYWKRDYVMMFADSWGFDFISGDSCCNTTLGKRVSPGWKGEVWNLINKYHGVKVQWKSFGDFHKDIAFIKNTISQNQPVAVSFDAFWCPWDVAYQKYHNTHYCLIIGEKDKQNLICIDPYVSRGHEIFPITELEKSYEKCIVFHIGMEENNNYRWRDVLFQANNIIINGAFSKMQQFADEICTGLDLKKEMEGCHDMHTVPLFEQLKKIGASRKNFAKVLIYLSEKFSVGELISLSDRLNNASNMWNKIRLKTMKMAIITSQQSHTEKIAEKIREIAEYEVRIAQDLELLVNRN